MSDLRERFRELDRLGQPDVWERVGHVSVRPVPPRQRGRRWLGAALAFAVAAASIGFAAWAF
jgi:hypothetical protein